MTPVKNHIHLSETKLITVADDLQNLMAKVFNEGLEGLVLKDINSIYEPGKRHWLKIKKDYLHDGSMADSADLVVLGAYYGTGNKGGMMSIFLMGTFDPDKQRWVTVTKCGIGFDDKKLEELNKELDMVKISKDMNLVSYT
uniref:ATP-dependent DNA ligase family profile domain-containing protein n=1 Tax=Biomphalaria glabrata TaxID=6526 RepID=A0A2C9LSK5_BIOGL